MNLCKIRDSNLVRIAGKSRIDIVIGKRSYSMDHLYENYKALTNSINGKKPDTVKKNFIARAVICTNHGPAYKVRPASVNRTNKNYEFK